MMLILTNLVVAIVLWLINFDKKFERLANSHRQLIRDFNHRIDDFNDRIEYLELKDKQKDIER